MTRTLTLLGSAFVCTPLLSAPVAVNDSYNATEDTTFSTTGGTNALINSTFNSNSRDVTAGTWHYLDKVLNHLGSPPGTGAYPVDSEPHAWTHLNFDVATSNVGPWGTGTMGSGAGIQGGTVDGIPTAPVLTGMTGGPGGQYLVTTYLFRKVFTLSAAEAAIAMWDAQVLADDGAVIHINGHEVGQVNMAANQRYNPDGTNTPLSTLTASTVSANETAVVSLLLNLTGKLNVGNNVVAVEVHQANTALNATGFSSSDVGLNFQLTPNATDGFVYVDDTFFGTNRPDFASGNYTATEGFNGTGALRVAMGNVFAQNNRRVSGGWRRTFTLSAAATVTLSLRHRLISGQDYDEGEYQELIVDINGTQYGTNRPLSGHNAIAFQVGNGNGGGAMDTGWQFTSLEIPLPAGNHTLTIGGYANEGSPGFNNAAENFQGFFDDISLTIPSAGGGVLTNDTGAAPMTAVKNSDPANGTLTFNADGTFSYTPAANFNGTDSFTYRAVDGTGTSDPATVTLNVAAVNDAPVAADDSGYSVLEGETLHVSAAQGLLINDTDVENSPLTASLAAQSAHGTATVNADGSFSFVPAANFSGPTTFTYRANDGSLNSAPGTVSINVIDEPDPPVANNDSYKAVKNTPLVITALTAGSFTDDVIPTSAPGWRYYNSIVLANRNLGTAWRQPGYVENADWLTGGAELGYGDGDEVTVIEDNPTAGYTNPDTNRFATSYFRRLFDVTDYHLVTAVQLQLLYDDAGVVFINGLEVARSNNLPSAATMPELAWDYYQPGFFNDNIVETWPLALTSIQAGTNLVAAQIHQNSSDSSDCSFNLRLRLTKAIQASLLANDTDFDPGTVLSIDSYTQPSHGTVVVNANGTFTYTPPTGHVGTVSFNYTVKDQTGLTATATASIELTTGANTAPVANADTYAATEDQVLNVPAATGVLANDTDAEDDPITAVIALPPSKGVVVLNANGSFTYTPNANANGPDSFTYTAYDGKHSPPATVTINIAPVNDPPVAVAETYFANPSEMITINAPGLLANDTDIDTPASSLTAQLATNVTGGVLLLNANGSFSYTAPATGGNYTFTYSANDGVASSPAVTVTFVVNGAPTAGNDNYPLVEDNTLNIAAPGVLANDSDPENQPLTAQVVTPPPSGTLNLAANGAFTFTPAANFNGPISFTYQVSDGVRTSAPATVTITVSNVNDAPVAVNNSYTVLLNTSLVVNAPGVLGNDSDPDVGTTLTATLGTNVSHGSLTFNSNGSFTYTPSPGYLGTDSFTYSVSDGLLTSNTATVSITVSPPTRDVIISEIMYHPAPSFPEPLNEEWLELYNRENVVADLSGWKLTNGVSFTFPQGTTIPPQGRLVVVANTAAFQAKFPTVTNFVGPWVGGLANNGERITLTTNTAENVDSVTYATEGDWGERYIETTFNGWDWRTLADGGGRSLELRNVAMSNDNGQNWGASTVVNGTPGVANSLATTQTAPFISKVRHRPAIPTSTDLVTISCELKDDLASEFLTATLFWRDATTTTPGAWNSVPMTGDGSADFFACIPPHNDKTIIEFYLSASDGTQSRTWPAPGILANGTPSQTANCQYQVDNEVRTATDTYYRVTLTAAENNAFNTVNSNSDRVFNQTLIIARGGETDIHYRAGMRIRGNSSRSYQFRPLRVTVPNDDPLDDGSVKFNLNPRAPHLQYLANRALQVVGLATANAIPVELRRNGVEFTTSSGTTPDFGKWARVEAEDGAFVRNHFAANDSGNIYKKVDGGSQTNRYWRSAGFTVPNNPDGNIDGWTKSNNSSTNDWTDLTNFFTVWQAAAAPHFPGAPATDVSQSNGGRLTGSGAWNGTALSAAAYASVSTVTDLDYLAKWFAGMTIVMSLETNLSNGVDDDYSAYFVPGSDGNRRFRPIPHDLDTVFGLGDTTAQGTSRGLYDMSDENQVFRTLLPLIGNNTSAGNATFRSLYHQHIQRMYGGIFNADTTANPNPPFHQFIDMHLTGWAPAAVIANIKNFTTVRQNHLVGLIGDGIITPPAATAHGSLNTAHGSLMLSEILAENTSAVNVGGTFPDFIELHNSGAFPVNLAGRSITDDPAQPTKYVFPAGTTIPAGGYLVLYADGLPGSNHLPFSLNDNGETVALYDSPANGGGVIDQLTYGLQIPNRSIGRTGSALQTWTLTAAPTPNAANGSAAVLGAPGSLFINEWLGNVDFRIANDFMEIYNPGANPVPIGGMSVTDDFANFPTMHVFPSLSYLPPASFTRFDFRGSNATPGDAKEISFKLGGTFGNLALLGANGTIVNIVDLISQAPDASTGRSTDGGNTIVAFSPPTSMPTPGLSNVAPSANLLGLLNHLRISEIHFNPSNGNDYEFIELTNTGSTALDLQGVRFVEGITFTFPAYSLPAGGHVVLARNPSRYPGSVGPYVGALDNAGETIGLQLPEPHVVYIQRFAYKDSWEVSADGGGSSLQIKSTTAYAGDWDESEAWQSASPNPGAPTPFILSAGPDVTILLGAAVFLDGTLSLGSSGAVTLTWSKVSGPGTVTFTNTIHPDTSARFSEAGIYTLRLASTGGTTQSDDVIVIVQDTYATWAARTLNGQSIANQDPTADPDKDGVPNAVEFAIGTNPLAPSPFGELTTENGNLGLRFNRSKLIDPEVRLFGEISSNLQNWSDLVDHLPVGETLSEETWIAQDPEPLGTHPRRQLRLRVVLP